MNTILFLCTGNYYRSRFSEEYFNHHADLVKLDWQADSMGVQRDFTGNGNVGPIANNTLIELKKLAIKPVGNERMPKRVETAHFSLFDKVIAVSIDEHQPMLAEHWPSSVLQNVTYFDVEDLHIEGPETALPRLKKHLDLLIKQLSE